MGKMVVCPVLSFPSQSNFSLSGNLHESHNHGRDSADSRDPGSDVTPLDISCMSQHGFSLPDPRLKVMSS